MKTDPILIVDQLTKGYPTAGGQTLSVLEDLNLTVERGEFVAITGESGCGKSTLLQVLGVLDRPDSGRVMIEGTDVFEGDDETLSRLRNERIGFVFQFHHLLPEFTALENVMMPALVGGQRPDEARRRATDLLAQVGLADRREHRPGELSGGEKQRVAIMRALMNAPDLVLADEPTGNLDEHTADLLHRELIRISQELGQTVIVVTHNRDFADMAGREMILEHGRLRTPD
ncbi:MAG: ABC transporter ATP-binding protein [Bacteroidetes bacterium]|jgi:lipoprotein-releasing system ATP-binding protein|nr:ABC transporter ATP-binding protein [Bacteroidota bacterium]